MVQHRGVAPDAIDLQFDARALREVAGLAAQYTSQVENRAFGLPRVRDLEDCARCGLPSSTVRGIKAAVDADIGTNLRNKTAQDLITNRTLDLQS